MLGRYLFARYGGSIVFLGRFVALLRAFAALLAGANRLSPWRFFVFNAAGIVWATIFGLGGYSLGARIHRIAGPAGWALLALALIVGFVLWRRFDTASRKREGQSPHGWEPAAPRVKRMIRFVHYPLD
jgi:membrane protein DedA with SNARE-associated domain